MTTRDRLTIAAAVAVALATSALRPLYEDLGWLLPVLGGIVAVSGAAALARLAAAPRALQPVAALLALLAYAALTFAGLDAGLRPAARRRETATSLAATFRDGLGEVEVLAPPVPTSPELVLLAVLGAGAVMVVVDTLAVVLRKVAVSGLPLLVLFAVPSACCRAASAWWRSSWGLPAGSACCSPTAATGSSRWGTPLRSARGSPSDPSLGRVGRRIGGAALGVALVVPVLVPGLDGRLLGGNGTGSGLGGSRTTTTYNPLLSLAGQLRQQTAQTLLTYRTTEGADYLRLTTLDLFDPDRGLVVLRAVRRHRRRPGAGRRPAAGRPQRPHGGRSRSPSTSPAGSAGRGCRCLRCPSDIDIDGPWLWDAEAETVFSTRTSVRDVDDPYTVAHLARAARRRRCCASRSRCPARIADVYARGPRAVGRRAGRARRRHRGRDDLLRQGRGAADASSARRTSSTPSRRRRRRPTAPTGCRRSSRPGAASASSSPRRWPRCVRGAGIPSRVAIGFLTGYARRRRRATASPRRRRTPGRRSGSRAPAGCASSRRPRSGEVDVDVPDYSVAPPESEDRARRRAQRRPPRPPRRRPVPASRPARSTARAEDGATGATGDAARRGPVAVVAARAGDLALLGVPALLAAVRRRRRWRVARRPRAPGRRSATTRVDVGHRWRPADSPRAAATHLTEVRHLPDDAAEALLRLAAGAERARYARTAPPADAAALRADAATVRAALLAGASPRERWLARLLPVSTVQSTSTRLGTAVADVLDRFDALVSCRRRAAAAPPDAGDPGGLTARARPRLAGAGRRPGPHGAPSGRAHVRGPNAVGDPPGAARRALPGRADVPPGGRAPHSTSSGRRRARRRSDVAVRRRHATGDVAATRHDAVALSSSGRAHGRQTAGRSGDPPRRRRRRRAGHDIARRVSAPERRRRPEEQDEAAQRPSPPRSSQRRFHRSSSRPIRPPPEPPLGGRTRRLPPEPAFGDRGRSGPPATWRSG